MKKFTYKNYKNCYFIVGSYVADKRAMAISIQSDGEPITTCTVYDDFGMYNEHITTIKNYSENSHMTDFLKELGVVADIIDRYPCNRFVYDTLETDNPQTMDICIIDIDKLKEYCKEWHYNV